MRLYRISGCHNEVNGELHNLQFTLIRGDSEGVADVIDLGTTGPTSLPPSAECAMLELDEGEYVTSMEISYTNNDIESAGFVTSVNGLMRWG